MGDRRMMSKKITDTDAFLSQSATTQLLYFHLLQRGDDDGFISNPKTIMKMIGSSEQDMLALINNKFVIAFDSGVVVIKHWRIHNYIAKDRYVETNWKDEKSTLMLDENGSYTKCIQPVYELSTQDKLSKDKLSKHKYGNYSNVQLTDDERLKLDEKYGNDTKEIISWFDSYIEEKGYKCKSHYLAILRWVGDAYYESLKRKPKPKEAIPVYNSSDNQTYDEEMFKQIMEKRNAN